MIDFDALICANIYISANIFLYEFIAMSLNTDLLYLLWRNRLLDVLVAFSQTCAPRNKTHPRKTLRRLRCANIPPSVGNDGKHIPRSSEITV